MKVEDAKRYLAYYSEMPDPYDPEKDPDHIGPPAQHPVEKIKRFLKSIGYQERTESLWFNSKRDSNLDIDAVSFEALESRIKPHYWVRVGPGEHSLMRRIKGPRDTKKSGVFVRSEKDAIRYITERLKEIGTL